MSDPKVFVRLQIYKSVNEHLKDIARQSGTTVSDMIRRGLASEATRLGYPMQPEDLVVGEHGGRRIPKTVKEENERLRRENERLRNALGDTLLDNEAGGAGKGGR